LRTLNSDEIKLNEAAVPWIAIRRASDAVDQATRYVGYNRIDLAKEALRGSLNMINRYKRDEKAVDGIRLLQGFLTRLESGAYSARDQKAVS
jgi:hypothetical protein